MTQFHSITISRYLKSNRDGSLPPELGQMDGFKEGDELVQEKLAPTLTVD